jgi:serine/threonine protein kinase
MPKSEAGDVLHGYRLHEPFRVANGGNCEWTFADRDGEEHFVKRFLSPKYPVARHGRPPAGDVASRLARCAAFESEQRKMLAAVRRVAGTGGRLVVPTDFFREGTSYFKVAPKVDATSLSVDEIAALPFDQLRSIMGAVVAAVQALHRAGIVHGDLSPSNILISRRGDRYSAHVIDFDSSFLVGAPPLREETVGNPPYYSPELLAYLLGPGSDGTTLTEQSDTFALGVVFWQYLYGSLPPVEEPFHYAAEAVRAGWRPSPPPTAVPGGAPDLLRSMLDARPGSRPSLRAVQSAIRRGLVDTPAPTMAAAPPPSPPRREWPRSAGSRVRSSRLTTTTTGPAWPRGRGG